MTAVSRLRELADRVLKIAGKQANALNLGWGHAIHCNFQREDIPRCNCGVADLQQLARELAHPDCVLVREPGERTTDEEKTDTRVDRHGDK